MSSVHELREQVGAAAFFAAWAEGTREAAQKRPEPRPPLVDTEEARVARLEEAARQKEVARQREAARLAYAQALADRAKRRAERQEAMKHLPRTIRVNVPTTEESSEPAGSPAKEG